MISALKVFQKGHLQYSNTLAFSYSLGRKENDDCYIKGKSTK